MTDMTLPSLAAECGLTQSAFGRMLGRGRGTVNRWSSPGRADSVAPPPEAIAFLLAFRRLSPADRAAVEAELRDYVGAIAA